RFGLPRTSDRDFLLRRSEGFLPGCQGVLARRQVLNGESTVVAGHAKVVGFKNHDVTVHPGMDVAFHRDKLGLIEFGVDGRGAWWLALIPFSIDFRERVDVV